MPKLDKQLVGAIVIIAAALAGSQGFPVEAEEAVAAEELALQGLAGFAGLYALVRAIILRRARAPKA